MAQTLLAFESHPTDPKIGFDIGWDHARHGLLPPAEQWLAGNPLGQGWRAAAPCSAIARCSPRGARGSGCRCACTPGSEAVRSKGDVTPHYLAQIEVALCPITRRTLVQADASVDRVCDRAGYAAGNLAMMSAAANRSKATLGWDAALQRAQQADAVEGGRVDGLGCRRNGRGWRCFVVFVTPPPTRGRLSAAARAAAQQAALRTR